MSADDDIDTLRDDILSAMTKVEDSTYRIVLSLMLRVIAAQQKLLKEMVERLDLVIEDEKRIKEIVLNGHQDGHHEHHDWLDRQLKNKEELEFAMRWAAKKMAEEECDRRSFKSARMQILTNILIAGITFVIGFHANKFLPALFGG